jgi:hypothetical protein
MSGPLRFRSAFVVLTGLALASGCGTTSKAADAGQVCRTVGLSPQAYRAARDQVMALRHTDREDTRASVHERLQAMLEGNDDADGKIAAIRALMRSVEADVGIPEHDTVLGAALTLSLLAHECGQTTASDPLPATDQDACSFGSIDVEESGRSDARWT